jgi:hypothetical protein
MLLPPDLRDWLPEGHLAHFVLDVVSTDGPLVLPGQLARHRQRAISTVNDAGTTGVVLRDRTF